MTLLRRAPALILLSIAASAANAAPTSYTFDSISAFDLGAFQVSITGILKNTSTPTTITWVDNTTSTQTVSRCVPVFLNMMDKAGRYYLNLTVDPAQQSLQTVSCGLQLKS